MFNVDIEEGKPPLKLPYNKTDDPWLAAQKFIHDNNLSQYYLEQVANFIVSNSTPAPTQSAVPTDFIDPFTGILIKNNMFLSIVILKIIFS